MNNSKVTLRGVVKGQPVFKFKSPQGERFFETTLEVYRLSHTIDKIPLLVSELHTMFVNDGATVKIDGEIRTRNELEGDRYRLRMFVLVEYAIPVEEEEEKTPDKDENIVELTGTICKKSEIRETPMGRVILDFLLAVNGSHNKCAYCPCIAWGRMAERAAKLNVGDSLKATCRFQSRTYQKNGQDMTAYELSVVSFEPVGADNENTCNNTDEHV